MSRKHGIVCVDKRFERLCEIIPKEKLLAMKVAYNGQERVIKEDEIPKDLMGRLVAVEYDNRLVTLNHWSFGNPPKEHPGNYYLKAEYASIKNEPEIRFYLIKSKRKRIFA